MTEGTLVQAIREIRRALDDDRDDPRFIQTVPRHGYRFVARVTSPASGEKASTFVAGDEPVEAVNTSRGFVPRLGLLNAATRRGLPFIVLAAFLAAALAYGFRPGGPLVEGSRNTSTTARPTPSAAGQQAYLRGRFYWNKRTKEGFQKAIEEFQTAIKSDPDYALPFAGLADTYVLMGDGRLMPAAKAHAQAMSAVVKALEIDNTIFEAHVTLGRLKAHEWDWAGADGAYKRAIELNPRSAAARHWYSNHLTNMGRHEEAIAEAKRALDLDPASVVINSGALGAAYLFAGRFDAAIEQYRKAQELDPGFANAHALAGIAYIRQRKYPEAVSELRRALALNNFAGWQAHLAYAYAAMGRRDDAIGILGDLETRPGEVASVILAAGHVALRETSRAFDLLERAFEAREPELTEIRTHLVFDLLREHPRFQDLLRRMNLS